MSRSSVYTLLSALIAKGIVSTTNKNEVKQFVAQDSDAIQAYLESKKRGLDGQFTALQEARELLEVPCIATSSPNVSFFEGQTGLQRVYMKMLRDCPATETIYLLRSEFVWQPEWGFIFEAEWSDRVSRIKSEKKLSTRLLINDSVKERSMVDMYQAKDSLQYRFLPKVSHISDFAQYTMGSMTATLSLEQGQLMGVLIDNSSIAGNHTQIFTGLWNNSTIS